MAQKIPEAQLRQLVESVFDVIPSRSTREELTIICEQPGCGDKSGNRSINLKTGLTNCWRCSKGGPLIPWMRSLGHDPDLSNLDLYDVGIPLEDLTNLQVEDTKRRLIAYTNKISLPVGFTKLSDEPDSGYTKLIGRMAKRKHLDLATFKRAGAGFTRESRLWEPYCIFPVTEWGKLVYYQGRTYTDVPGESTKRFPSRKDIPLGSRHWIFNIDRLREKGKIAIVVESIFNALSLENAIGLDSDIVPVAIFKHKISIEQQTKLLGCRGLREVCLLFDPDAIGAAWDSCRSMTNLLDVTVADDMPHGVDANDDVEKAVHSFDRRKKFTTLNSLSRLVADL